MIKARDWDWLVFQRKRLIGRYIVQFLNNDFIEKIGDVGLITDIRMSGEFYRIDVDGKNWFLYGFDIILPELTEDEDSLTINDKILGIRSVIFLKKEK